MGKPIIAVDVDEPIVSTGKAWKRYLDAHYTLKSEYRFTQPDPLPYNLSEMYIHKEDTDGIEFFNYFKLYDNLQPREDALEYLPVISKYFDIVFVSKISGDHFCSKRKFVDKYFPYHKGLYGTTKTKAHINCDVFVDDCYSNLNEMYQRNPEVDCIKFRTDYDEGIEPISKFPVVYSWEHCWNLLQEKYCI